jgi:hypothetical protein
LRSIGLIKHLDENKKRTYSPSVFGELFFFIGVKVYPQIIHLQKKKPIIRRTIKKLKKELKKKT